VKNDYNGDGSTVTWVVPTASTPTWENGKSYLIKAKALDMSDNESEHAAIVFTYDNDPPTANLLRPSPQSSYNSIPTISGTAGDAAGAAQGSVDKVYVRIYNYGNTQWYNRGSDAFNIAQEDGETAAAWFVADEHLHVGVWTATFTKWTPGWYYDVIVKVQGQIWILEHFIFHEEFPLRYRGAGDKAHAAVKRRVLET